MYEFVRKVYFHILCRYCFHFLKQKNTTEDEGNEKNRSRQRHGRMQLCSFHDGDDDEDVVKSFYPLIYFV